MSSSAQDCMPDRPEAWGKRREMSVPATQPRVAEKTQIMPETELTASTGCPPCAAALPSVSSSRPVPPPSRPTHCMRVGRFSPAKSQPASSMLMGVEAVMMAAVDEVMPC